MAALSLTAERRQEEKEQRRQDIIHAAEAVFARKGVDAATMGDIAKEARLSRGLLYVYFNDKDDLSLAITRRGFQALRETFEQVTEQHQYGCEKIRAIGEAYVRFSQTHPLHFDMMARFEGREVDPEAADSNESGCLGEGNRIIHHMADVLRLGIEDGSIRPDVDPVRTAISLWGFIHGIIQLLAKKGSMLATNFDVHYDPFVTYALDLMGASIMTEAARQQNTS